MQCKYMFFLTFFVLYDAKMMLRYYFFYNLCHILLCLVSYSFAF